ncbi:hypothetical protein XPR_1042 [Xanthomonas arboricola pv. pruni MAFF 301420]|uniref:Uncharacterized protein n=2 Tax=Xanthomonas arboricola pv. pruni TaxID=69929 RepID=W4SDF3_9XANT|nr:hypothetical protein XPU_2390 [Xanthomonas arboricola pv. pruni str. MAFF 311562]GAE54407.1 hypothetical protein XPR_1042 [Xanthomonas arboricola pv. pruni MAFF 301420]GAE58835.1 hypothetical protein XPN_0741 [Xanthomonas arboricola pv. pruni MAFF 301427]
MQPKIKPARNASRHCGLRIAAPLPIAAANASVDIAKPIKTMEKGDIDILGLGTVTTTCARANRRRARMPLVSPNRNWLPAPRRNGRVC